MTRTSAARSQNAAVHGAPNQPVRGRGVWRREDVADPGINGGVDGDNWRYPLTGKMVDDVRAAIASARARGTALRDLTAENFPLPSMEGLLAEVRDALGPGRGFALMTGLPVERLSSADAGLAFSGIGAHLGVSVTQSHLGDYLGDVIDRGDPVDRRPYHNGGEFIMHRDPVDLVGLLCLRGAKRGGESRIVSAGAVHNALLAEAPEALAPLYEGFAYGRLEADRGATDLFTPYRIPVFRFGADGSFMSHYIPGPIDRAFLRDGARDDDPGVRAVAAFKRLIWERPELYYDMTLAPGDMQFVNNRTVLHGRTDYEDWPEPDRRRHLLRLWLMVPDWGPPPRDQIFYENIDRAGGGIAGTR